MKNTQQCLSIETTGDHLGLTWIQSQQGKPPRLRFNYFERRPLQQSEVLFPTLARLMKKKNLKKSAVDLLAVNVGPGSFTGVRVGVAAARALAQALKKPLIGIGGLEAMAYQAGSSSLVVSCLPALAGEVYYAVYQVKGEKELKPIVSPRWEPISKMSQTLKKLSKKNILSLVGDRADNIRAALPGFKKVTWRTTRMSPHPRSLAELALHRYGKTKKKNAFDFRGVVPLYLQPSWAERKNKPTN